MVRIVLLFFASMLFCVQASGMIINEVMQSNVNTLYVEHEFPDSWVELYNDSDVPALLNEYSLGLNKNGSERYQLSGNVEIAPGEYVVIYCDKLGEGLHTDFRVDSGKGEVCLFKGDELIEVVALAKQPAPDIAFGRVKNAEWAYMEYSTPGAKNGEAVENGVLLPNAVIAPQSRIITSPIEVTVGLPEGFMMPQGGRLCITTDGREPLLSDSVAGVSYSIITNENTILRAKIIVPGLMSPMATTASYIYKERDTKLSIVSIVVDPEYFYDVEKGIFSDGVREEDYEEYHYNKWRRPINIEFFSGESHELKFSQLCEARVYGSLSRIVKQKSLCVYANKRFGVKRFNTNGIWLSKPQVGEVKSMIIRNAGQDTYTRMADAYAQSLAGNAREDIEWEDNHPVVLYINGKYQGHYNLRERSDEDWFESNLGTENVDIVENYYDVVTGELGSCGKLREILQQPSAKFSDIESFIDVDNWLFVLAYNTYGNNVDFPTNNFRIWKGKEENAKWRHILKDMDFWFGRWTYGYATYFDFIDSWLDESNEMGYMPEVRALHILMNDPAISDRYADILTFLCGDFARKESALKHYHAMLDRIKDEYEATVRFIYTDEEANWLMSVIDYQRYTRFTNFLTTRGEVIASQVSEKYNYGAPCRVYFDHSEIKVALNGIELRDKIYDGYYYCGKKIQVTLPDTLALEVKVENQNGAIRKVEVERDNSFLIPDDAKQIWIASYKMRDYIGEITDNKRNARYYDLRGVEVKYPKRGEIYIEIVDGKAKKVAL